MQGLQLVPRQQTIQFLEPKSLCPAAVCSRSHIPIQKQEKTAQRELRDSALSLHLIGQSGHPQHSQSYGSDFLSLCLLELKVTLHTLSNPLLVPLLLKSVSIVSEVDMFQRNRIFVWILSALCGGMWVHSWEEASHVRDLQENIPATERRSLRSLACQK